MAAWYGGKMLSLGVKQIQFIAFFYDLPLLSLSFLVNKMEMITPTC